MEWKIDADVAAGASFMQTTLLAGHQACIRCQRDQRIGATLESAAPARAHGSGVFPLFLGCWARSSISPTEMSTIILPSWFGSRGRFL